MPDASQLTRRALVEVASLRNQPTSPKDPIVRRYRLARVPLYAATPALDRFAHLRRSYD